MTYLASSYVIGADSLSYADWLGAGQQPLLLALS
jgi:hypothetical protein